MAHSVENSQLYLGEKYLITTVCFLHRVLQNQMIRDTYTPEAIQALKRIKYVCLTVLLLTSVESLSLETIFN